MSWDLFREDAVKETEIIRTLWASLKDMTDAPSWSDIQRAVRPLLVKFDIDLRVIPEPLKYKCNECEGAGKFVQHPQRHEYIETKCEGCKGRGYVMEF